MPLTDDAAGDGEVAEPKAKKPRVTPTITSDMSPGTKAKIESDRAERKRFTSRAWHGKFASKAASRTILFLFAHSKVPKGESKNTEADTNPGGEASSSSAGPAKKKGSEMHDARWTFAPQCEFCMRLAFKFEVRAYLKNNPGSDMKIASQKWMESSERASFIAGRNGVQI